MKYLVLLGLVLGFSAHAKDIVKIGDRAEYQTFGKLTKTTSSRVWEVTDYNPKKDSYLLVETEKKNGKKVTINRDWLTTEKLEALYEIYGMCDDLGGEKEILTIPAGRFDTCRFTPPDGGTIWFAKVPLGIVKMQTPDNVEEPETIWLERYRWAPR